MRIVELTALALLIALPWPSSPRGRALGAQSQSQSSGLVAADSMSDIRTIAKDYLALDRATTQGDALPNRSPAEMQKSYAAQDRLRHRLQVLDPRTLTGPAAIAYAILDEKLRSLHAIRVCRTELWDLNHLTGWQVRLPPLAAAQSVGTAADRERALRRWSSLPEYIDTDIANLRAGVTLGYSAPKSVVRRVLQQIDALLGAQGDAAPFARAARSDDTRFRVEWRTLVAEKIHPALERFADFLRNEYLPAARDSIGVSSLPDGGRCYAALLRQATTLDRSPRATFDLGTHTVARSQAELEVLGGKMFGTTAIADILKRAKAAPANRFPSAADLLSYSNSMLSRSIHMSAEYFFSLPRQAIKIKPMPSYQQGSGISSHYEAEDAPSQPALYRIDLDDWADETRGAAAVTVVHETIPGHHLQTAIARATSVPGEMSEFSFNAAYVEGWANYAERLSEEAGIYDNPYAAIFRRAVLGQSLIVDPAVHVMGWSRERVRTYLESLGQTEREADELIDRIAVQPAQLTSYETGGLEILALRDEAKAALGSRFDIREFHQRVLEEGDVPLTALREHLRAWIRAEQRRRKS